MMSYIDSGCDAFQLIHLLRPRMTSTRSKVDSHMISRQTEKMAKSQIDCAIHWRH